MSDPANLIVRYNITSTNWSTDLLNYDFDVNCINRMTINGEDVEPCVGYKFSSTGEYEVKFWFKSLNNVENLFSNMRYITYVDVSNLDLINCTSMYNMFYYTTNVSHIYGLDKLNTSNIMNMSYVFDTCGAEVLNLSNWDTSNVTNMEGMFYSTYATAITVDGFNTNNVSNMADMFKYASCPVLDLSSFNMNNVVNTSGMFDYLYTDVVQITFGDQSNISNVSNYDGMFNLNDSYESYNYILSYPLSLDSVWSAVLSSGSSGFNSEVWTIDKY